MFCEVPYYQKYVSWDVDTLNTYIIHQYWPKNHCRVLERSCLEPGIENGDHVGIFLEERWYIYPMIKWLLDSQMIMIIHKSWGCHSLWSVFY